MKELKKFRGTSNLKNLYRNESDKACFAHDAAYSDSKDLTKKIISDKILKDRVYEIAWNWKYDGYKELWQVWSINCLIRNMIGSDSDKQSGSECK